MPGRLHGEARAGHRGDAVGPHAVAVQLHGVDDGHGGDARLGGRVVRLADVAVQPGARARVDDGPVGDRAGLGRRRASTSAACRVRLNVPFRCTRDHVVELLLAHGDEHPVAQDAGVVDHDVEVAEASRRPGRPSPWPRRRSSRCRCWPRPGRPAAVISSTTDCAAETSAPEPSTAPPRSLTTTLAPERGEEQGVLTADAPSRPR